MPPSLAIVIVSFNCREPLRQCLSGLQVGGTLSRVVVIDNASTDGTAEMIRQDFSSALLVANAENRGFAAACNQGIRATTEEFVLLLNPDTLPEATGLRALLQTMIDQPTIGACGPRILNPDGTLQRSCRRFPTLGVILCAELGWQEPYRMSGWAHDTTREVDQLMGSCLLLRRAALEQVGLLDERFFLYFEEVDLCWRLKRAGWRVLFVSQASVVHLGGQSSAADRSAALRHRYRSLFEFYRKHFPRWQLPLLRGAVQLGALLRALTGKKDYWVIVREAWKL
jgi:GT2 family glycosyltransferase